MEPPLSPPQTSSAPSAVEVAVRLREELREFQQWHQHQQRANASINNNGSDRKAASTASAALRAALRKAIMGTVVTPTTTAITPGTDCGGAGANVDGRSRNTDETITLLARMARFVVADKGGVPGGVGAGALTYGALGRGPVSVCFRQNSGLGLAFPTTNANKIRISVANAFPGSGNNLRLGRIWEWPQISPLIS
jgi:hypothetical protein